MKRRFLIFFLASCAVWGAQSLPAQNTQEADSLHQLGRTLINRGEYAEGRRVTQQALEMRRALYGENSPEYLKSFENIAISYGMEGNFDKSIEMLQAALAKRKALTGELDKDYINTLNNIAVSYDLSEDYPNAIVYGERVMALCEQLPAPSPDYWQYAQAQGRRYFLTDDKRNAVRCWEKALEGTEQFTETHGKLLDWLGSLYMDLGDRYNQMRIMALIEQHNSHELTKDCHDTKCRLERAGYYSNKGDHAKAKDWYLLALKNAASPAETVEAQKAYGDFLAFTMRDFLAGAELLKASAQGLKTLEGETLSYGDRIKLAGNLYFLADDYEASLQCYTAAAEVFSRLEPTSARRAEVFKGMGNSHKGLRDYASAAECYKEVVAYYQKNDAGGTEYPKALESLATAEKFNKDYDAAIEHYLLALQLMEERNMMDDYGKAASSLQLCYLYAGKTDKVDMDQDKVKAARNARLDSIIKDETESLELIRTYLGVHAYAKSLGVIAGSYALEEKYLESVDYYKQYIPVVRKAIRDEFSLQDEVGRMATWSEHKSTLRTLQEMLLAPSDEQQGVQADLAALNYDAALLSKGILLNSSIEFSKILFERGDKPLLSLYEQTKNNAREIERLRQEAQTDKDWEKVVSLSRQNEELQLRLNRECKELGDFTDYIDYDWHKVQAALSPGDVAVEFVAVNIGWLAKDNVIFALVLTPDASQPSAIPVCSFLQAKDMQRDDSLFVRPGNPVWGGILQGIQNCRRLFFAADGLFNQIAIEYLAYEGSPLFEQMEVYRLSSTKEICIRHPKRQPHYVALFGNINYNEGQHERSVSTTDALLALRGDSYFDDLPATQKEVDSIMSVIKTSLPDCHVSPFASQDATEEVFLALDGSRVDILHVATHGVYADSLQASDAEAMTRSRLVFAGANMPPTPSGGDGLVTAAEVAGMNLRQCDLAVLSACETGLGKAGADGVFGLQRGFKNAGVHTLMMSLKKVYDATTADLMTVFYRHLMNGATKREALMCAQQELRAAGFTDAKYWATFILLDAWEK